MGVVLVLPLAKTSQANFFSYNVIEKAHQGKLYYQKTDDRRNVSLINI